MEQNTNKLHATTSGFGLSVAFISVLSTILVVAKEENPALLAYMKSLTGHHWITHGLAVMFAFIVTGIILSLLLEEVKMKGESLSVTLFLSTAVGGLGILGYFLLPYLG